VSSDVLGLGHSSKRHVRTLSIIRTYSHMCSTYEKSECMCIDWQGRGDLEERVRVMKGMQKDCRWNNNNKLHIALYVQRVAVLAIESLSAISPA
jgi:hypothetical protein